jgi:hypothetical protein
MFKNLSLLRSECSGHFNVWIPQLEKFTNNQFWNGSFRIAPTSPRYQKVQILDTPVF